MVSVDLKFLPYPHVYRGERFEGMNHKWLAPCMKCDRQCESGDIGELGLCSYGVNFLRIDEDLLVAGIVAKDYPLTTGARSRMLKTQRSDVVPSAHIRAVAERADQIKRDFEAEIANEKSLILASYRESEGYKQDVVGLLKPDLEQTFAQVHDYRALTTQIIQNVNVILQRQLPEADIDTQLKAVSPNVRSIYWAARLMDFKLQSALFLANPERITDPAKKRVFRLHGAVKKYVGIYESSIVQRRLRLHETGTSFGSLMANPDAVGVIPHAFLDNAIKYAPDGTDVTLHFSETQNDITFSVTSVGPKIAKDEKSHLFDLFFRGHSAKASGEDGTGFGLGLAQTVADEIGAVLSVVQSKEPMKGGKYETTFTAVFRTAAREESVPGYLRARARTKGGVPTA